LADPQRPFGPREPRVAATPGCGDGGEDLSGRRIDLLDAILGNLIEMLSVECCSGVRRDVERTQCFATRRVEGLERLSRSKPDLLAVVGDSVDMLDPREAVLTENFGRCSLHTCILACRGVERGVTKAS